MAVAVGGKGPQWELNLRGRQDNQEEGVQEDHVNVKRNQVRRRNGQDKVKLNQMDAEPDNDVKVHVTCAKGDIGRSHR